MKFCCLVFMLVLINKHCIAQSDYLFIGHASGSPLLYNINKSEQKFPEALKTSKAWNVLTGQVQPPNEADLLQAKPRYFRDFPPRGNIYIGKSSLQLICVVGDSLLAVNDKGNVFL